MIGPGEEHRPHFKVALNLPHAGRIARRILPLLPQGAHDTPDVVAARRITLSMVTLLDPCFELDENPADEIALPLRDRVADLARRLVDHIEHGCFGGDRLGQCVRNLFECLELGAEGAEISLRAGEDPDSVQRPR